MHHRPSGPLSSAVAAALRGLSPRLARRRRSLLLLAVGLMVASGSLLAVPSGTAPVAAPGSGLALDAAAKQVLQQAADGADGGATRRGTGDHRRAEKAAAATPNAACTLLVPSRPTSQEGLTTAYRLVATDPAQGPCHEADADQSAFVEAAVLDPARHEISIYHPLVVDDGDRPAVPPVPVTLPAGAVVAVWFGFNGDTLTLDGPGAGACVNGLPGSPFGQFAYCGAPAFFAAAQADRTLQANIPQLGTGVDGRPCPTTRDFSVVDQDQSDNLATAYRLVRGRIAQVTQATAVQGTPLTNGSDEGLLAKFVAPALGCHPWKAQDLTDPGSLTPALALNELSAARWQTAPALVPTSDPMVQVDGKTSTRKTELYRAGVGQPALPAGQTPRAYCAGILHTAPDRLVADARWLRPAPSPTPDQPNLLAFLRDRLTGTVDILGCR